jgi:hypothetical protein
VSILVSLLSGVAESLFATLFPSDCRLCGAPLNNISCLPVGQPCPAGAALRVLERRRETQSQTGLTGRRENIGGAVGVVRPEQIAGREVLVVDDVFTTGTTVSECARVLRRAGAFKIYVTTVARTPEADAQGTILPRTFADREALAAAG